MSNTWMIFPTVQVIISLVAAAITFYYGSKLAHSMGGGIMQKIVWMASINAFLLASYTIIGLWGYFSGNSDTANMTKRFLILIMSICTLILGYYVKKFADAFSLFGVEE